MEILYINKHKKRKRVKKSVLLFAAAGLLLGLVLLLVLMHLGGYEGKIQSSSISAEANVNAVIIRNESVLSCGEYDIAERYLPEGSSVYKGERIMDVYKQGFNREMLISMWSSAQDIYKAQLEALGESRDVKLRQYDNSVESALNQISKAVISGDTRNLPALKDGLTGLLTQRAEYIKSTVPETDALRALYRKQEDREQSIEDSRSKILAESDGILSYYCDDYSVALMAEKLSIMSADLIDSVIKKSQKAVAWTGRSKSNACRIVDGNEWYMAFTTPLLQGMRVVSGEKYRFSITGYGEYEGTGETSFISGTKVVNIIRVSADIGTLINARTVKARITFTSEGLRVEKRALQFEKGGEPYVELMIEGKRIGVYVNVHSEDGSGAIISAKDSASAPLKEGAKYWIPKKSRSRR